VRVAISLLRDQVEIYPSFGFVHSGYQNFVLYLFLNFQGVLKKKKRFVDSGGNYILKNITFY
jgi:hypothetical protein